MASNTDDIGSDEATEGMQDLCAFCVDKGKPQPASQFCLDCGPFGRYICGVCVQNHNYFTSGHIVKRLSDAVRHKRMAKGEEQRKTVADEKQKKDKEEVLKVKEEKVKLGLEMEQLLRKHIYIRTGKIAERFSDLYDNQWTDAFEMFDKKGNTEEKTIALLLDIVMAAFQVALDGFHEEQTKLTTKSKDFYRDYDGILGKDVHKHLEDTYAGPGKELKKTFLIVVKTAVLKDVNDVHSLCEENSIKSYIGECLRVCWLMTLNNPPLYIVRDGCRSGDTFDQRVYKFYTRSGKIVEFMVWPPIFVNENGKGSNLCRGIAQAKTEK